MGKDPYGIESVIDRYFPEGGRTKQVSYNMRTKGADVEEQFWRTLSGVVKTDDQSPKKIEGDSGASSESCGDGFIEDWRRRTINFIKLGS